MVVNKYQNVGSVNFIGEGSYQGVAGGKVTHPKSPAPSVKSLPCTLKKLELPLDEIELVPLSENPQSVRRSSRVQEKSKQKETNAEWKRL